MGRENFELERLSKNLTRGIAALCTLGGSIVFVGWPAHLHHILAPFTGYHVMIPNTALAFILCGISLLMFSMPTSLLARQIGYLTAVLAIVIGGATLLEYGLHRSLLDQLFVGVVGVWPPEANHGRMAPNSAIEFFIAGVALLFTGQKRPREAERLGVLVGIIAILALLGYVYRIESLYGIGSYAAMAPQTALSFVVLAVGILSANPAGHVIHALLNPDTSGMVTRRLLVISTVGIVVLGWLRVLALRAHYLDPDFDATILIAVAVVIVSWTILHMADFVHNVELQREKAMQELQENREWLSTTLTSIGDGVIATDAQGNVSFMNTAAESMTGWTADDAHLRPLTDIFSIVDELTGEPTVAPVLRAVATGNVANTAEQSVLVTREGKRIPIADSAAPIRNEAGDVVGAVLVFRDVTEKREGEKSNLFLASIVESSQEAIYGTTLNGIITSWNRGAERMYGYTREEVIGQFVGILKPPSRSGELDGIMKSLRRGEGVGPLETTRLRKDGREINVSINLGPISDKPGHIAGVSCIVRDITAARKAEEVLRATEKLAAAGRIAAVMAHEINNPLEAVTNLLYLLEQNPRLDAQGQEYVKIAAKELTRVAHISKQTLAFYRESSQTEEVDLKELLEGLVAMMTPHRQRDGIRIEQRYGPDLRVVAYPSELRQVFSNLLVNALDATGRSGVIYLHANRGHDWRDSRQAGVHISIADNGPGIPRESLNIIFEPFVTTKGEKGTGLGLWVSQGIVQKHGGYIHVRSNVHGPRRGTCFSIFLPSNHEKLAEESASGGAV